MYYDLNVLWSTKDAELQRNLSFLAELGYNVIALNHLHTGKLPTDIKCPIPTTLPFAIPPSMRILRRITLITSDTSLNYRFKDLNDASSGYDILAVRPTDEKTFSQACLSLDCDIISLDLTLSYLFYFQPKYKTLKAAVDRGIRFEICYGPGISSRDRQARKTLIENATSLIRALKGRNIVISSEASSAIQCRAPADIVNLATVWGLGQERGMEAITKEARSVVVAAQIKRTSYRGVIDVVYGGEKPVKVKSGKKEQGNGKRKAADMSMDLHEDINAELPLSNTQRKKRARKEAAAKKAEEEQASTSGEIPDASAVPQPP